MNSFFCNKAFEKGEMKRLIYWFLINNGTPKTLVMVDRLKTLGFSYATQAGISLGIEDLKIPPVKPYLLKNAQNEIYSNKKRFGRGKITAVEHSQKVIDIWNTTSELLKDEVVVHFRQTDLLNPVYMMAFSGARGNISQVRQLVGMRGLMSDPQGEIIDLPIQSNFREGLTVTEYIISCYGARKGLVDTALKTANSGYLTRRLVDVAQAVIVNQVDCRTMEGIFLTDLKEDGKVLLPLEKRLVGRVLGKTVQNPKTGKTIALRNQDICSSFARKIAQAEIAQVFVRSPLTCQNAQHVCKFCYGWSLAHGQLVDLGEAVGIIAAQSIGEPGTQLTMRTFHTGGVFASDVADRVYAPHGGRIQYESGKDTIETLTIYGQEAVYFRKEKEITIDPLVEESERTTLELPPYTLIFVSPGQEIYTKQVIAEYSTLNQIKNTKKEGEGIKTRKDVLAEIQGQTFFHSVTRLNGKCVKPSLLYLLAGQIIPESGFRYPLSLQGDIIPSSFYASTSEKSKKKGIFSYHKTTLSGGVCFQKKALSNKEKQQLLWLPTFQKNQKLGTVSRALVGTPAVSFHETIGSSYYYFSVLFQKGLVPWFEKSHRQKKGIQKKISTFKEGKQISLQKSHHLAKKYHSANPTLKKNARFFDYCFEHQGFFIPESFPYEASFPCWFYFPKQIGKNKKQWKKIFENSFSIVEPYTKVVDNICFNESIFHEWAFLKNSNPICIFRKSVEFFVSENQSYPNVETLQLNYGIPIGVPLIRKKEVFTSFKGSSSTLNFFSSGKKEKENKDLQHTQKNLLVSKPKKNEKTEILFVETKQKNSRTQTNKQFLVSTPNNFFRFSIKDLRPIVSPSSFVLEGECIAKGVKTLKTGELEEIIFKTPETGIIHKVTEDFILLRSSRAYKAGRSSNLSVTHADLVYEGNTLFDLVYTKEKTGDIVQGLPKIEELLEARRTKDLEPIVNNPHDRLKEKFERYRKSFPIEFAVKKSLLEIQKFLVDGVQGVYQSQGVSISDKHIEIIVKQMTSKVFIEDGGGTPLMYGELVELDQIKKTCKKASKRGYKLPTYEPVILGITKASLKTESFLSAASFQETTRVLTQAAIQGRVDTFKGLKENVIMGRLIPAGTGFLSTNAKSFQGNSPKNSLKA